MDTDRQKRLDDIGVVIQAVMNELRRTEGIDHDTTLAEFLNRLRREERKLR